MFIWYTVVLFLKLLHSIHINWSLSIMGLTKKKPPSIITPQNWGRIIRYSMFMIDYVHVESDRTGNLQDFFCPYLHQPADVSETKNRLLSLLIFQVSKQINTQHKSTLQNFLKIGKTISSSTTSSACLLIKVTH